MKQEAVHYLRQQYTNADGEMICQICKTQLPFRSSSTRTGRPSNGMASLSDLGLDSPTAIGAGPNYSLGENRSLVSTASFLVYFSFSAVFSGVDSDSDSSCSLTSLGPTKAPLSGYHKIWPCSNALILPRRSGVRVSSSTG